MHDRLPPPLTDPARPGYARVRPMVDTMAAADCVAPLEFYGRLRAATSGDHCLLESGGPQSAASTRSLIAARALVRLEIRGAEVTCTPLVSAAAPLLPYLAARLPAPRLDGGVLRATMPLHRDAAGDDDARLRSPGVLDALRLLVASVADEDGAAAPLAPGLFGVFGYEIVDAFEHLPPRRRDPLDEPDASFVLVTDLVGFDRSAGTVQVVTRPLPDEAPAAAVARHARYRDLLLHPAAPRTGDAPAPVPDARSCRADVSDRSFLAAVERLQQHIAAGEIFQGVLSRGFSLRSAADDLAVYRELTRANPSPYMFHIDLAAGSVLGASPETFLRVEDGEIEIRPIAGTVGRGFAIDGSLDPDADARLALQLMLDPKEQAEHAMLLDLARNDVARAAEPGTMRVVQQLGVEKYSHVQHLVSRVRGTLRRGFDALHAYRAAANMGTLTGAPKLRAMELIRETEPYARGLYGGAAGYLLQDGRFDSCIVIRSLRYKDGVFHTRAGAGVVADSVPARELEETAIKARACLEAVLRAGAAQAREVRS